MKLGRKLLNRDGSMKITARGHLSKSLKRRGSTARKVMANTLRSFLRLDKKVRGV